MPKLRLLFVLVLSLALPWSGCEYIHQKEQLMRSMEADKLMRQAQQLAEVIEPELQQKFARIHADTTANKLYLYRLPEKILLDGYHDDWGIDLNSSMEYSNRLNMNQPPGQGLTIMAGYNNNYLYLFFQLTDNDTLYSSQPPGDQLADHIVLDIEHHTLAGRHFLQVTAPGQFEAFRKIQDELDNVQLINTNDIQGYWQDTTTGYNVELRLPVAEPDTRLGFSAYDYDRVNEDQIRLMGQYGNQSPDQQSTAVLLRRLPALQSLLDQSPTTASRVYVLHPEGWILASKYSTPHKNGHDNRSLLNQTLFDILSQLYQFVSNLRDSPASAISSSEGRVSGQTIDKAARNITASSWYKKPGSNQPVMSIAYPIKTASGALAIIVIEQSSSAFLSLQNPEFLRNIAYSLFMIIILSLLTFIYTWKLAKQLFTNQSQATKP